MAVVPSEARDLQLPGVVRSQGALSLRSTDDNAWTLSRVLVERWPLHHHAAVDRQDLAGDVFRLRRGEEGNRGRDVCAFAEFA